MTECLGITDIDIQQYVNIKMVITIYEEIIDHNSRQQAYNKSQKWPVYTKAGTYETKTIQKVKKIMYTITTLYIEVHCSLQAVFVIF